MPAYLKCGIFVRLIFALNEPLGLSGPSNLIQFHVVGKYVCNGGWIV